MRRRLIREYRTAILQHSLAQIFELDVRYWPFRLGPPRSEPGGGAAPEASVARGMRSSGDDDSGFFALEFPGGGELAAEKFEIAARPGAAVAAQQAHTVEKDEQRENFGVFGWRSSGLFGGLLLRFVEELRERAVQLASKPGVRRFLVEYSRTQCLVGFGKSLERGQYVGIASSGMRGGKFCGRECQSGKQILLSVDDLFGNLDVQQRSVPGQRSVMRVLVAVGREHVRTVRGTVDGNFALRATAHGANFLALRRTESCCFSFKTERTGHGGPQGSTDKPAEYSREG